MTSLFKNAQWKVTKYGIEANDGGYPIKGDRLTESGVLGSLGRLYDWPAHMAEKNWVNLPLFLEAFEACAKLRGVTFDEAMWQRSVDLARRIRARYYGD